MGRRLAPARSFWPGAQAKVGYWPDYAAQRPEPEAREAERPEAPITWREWLLRLFARYVRGGFAERHVEFWRWLWAITLESDPDPFVGIWPRGGAKTTSAELGTATLGIRGRRRYALYVRGSQDRADDSVQNVAAMLESDTVALYYPEHSTRMLGKFGSSKGWRRNRLRTAGGFTVDALGLDTMSRGVKLDDQRPDLIVFDDIDARHDSPKQTEKKLTTIKESILPAGADNAAVIGIQNLIIKAGVFAQLADGRADFLTRRIVSGPEPALVGMKTVSETDARSGIVRARITAGRPTWQGQDVAACQRLMNRIGFRSFERECQHNVADREGALWTCGLIEKQRVNTRAARYKRIVVAVDPSGGGTEIGIVAGGLRYDGHVDTLADETQKGALGPRNWAKVAVKLYHDLGADRLVAEKNFGGDMVESNIKTVDPRVSVKLVTASRGKDVRAEPVATLMAEGREHHVGHFPELEAELTGWVPGDPESPNRLDAKVWMVTELALQPAAEFRIGGD